MSNIIKGNNKLEKISYVISGKFQNVFKSKRKVYNIDENGGYIAQGYRKSIYSNMSVAAGEYSS